MSRWRSQIEIRLAEIQEEMTAASKQAEGGREEHLAFLKCMRIVERVQHDETARQIGLSAQRKAKKIEKEKA